jgi:hypothetical protein
VAVRFFWTSRHSFRNALIQTVCELSSETTSQGTPARKDIGGAAVQHAQKAGFGMCAERIACSDCRLTAEDTLLRIVIDVRLFEGTEFRRTQLVRDSPECERLRLNELELHSLLKMPDLRVMMAGRPFLRESRETWKTI